MYFSSPLALTHRLLAFDLSRYGDSSNAPIRRDVQSAYTDAALDFLKYMKVKEVIVIGWSLRGRIVIEMLDKLTHPEHATSKLGIRMCGFMIVGTRPSLDAEKVQDGFTGKG